MVRHWPGEKNRAGHLMHRGGGWALDYDPTATDDDEPGFKFHRHRFAPGGYVSIRERDGTLRTFRVAWVRDLD